MRKNYSKLILPTVYVCIMVVVVLSIFMILNGIKNFISDEIEYNYTLDNVFEKDVLPVMNEITEEIVRPYVSDTVKIGKYFYDIKSTNEKQENSLIYYENTYMQNSGVDYTSDEDFDVVSILNGEVVSVEDNELFGNIITIKHNDNLVTVYSCVKDVLVATGAKVAKGEIIAQSDESRVNNEFKSALHFEVYYKGEVIDPENLYSLSIEDLN